MRTNKTNKTQAWEMGILQPENNPMCVKQPFSGWELKIFFCDSKELFRKSQITGSRVNQLSFKNTSVVCLPKR